MNEKELRRKLINERLHDATGLSMEERRLLEGDRRLQEEMQLNLVIDANRPEPPATPDVAGQIDRALRRTAELNVVAARPVGRRRRVLAFALAAVVLLAVLAVLPWHVTYTDDGFSLIRRDAWASVEGHVLLYFVESREYYRGTAEDSPEHPACRLQVVAGDWSAARADERPRAVAADVATVEVGQPVPAEGGGGYYQWVRINIYAPGEDLPEDLAGLITAETGLAEPEVRPETWFRNTREYPGRYFPGRTLVVDGREYAYPREVGEPDNPVLTSLIDRCGSGGEAYLALAGGGELAGLDVSGLARVDCRRSGEVEITSTGDAFDTAALGMPDWLDFLMLELDAGETCSPEEAVTRLGALAADIAGGNAAVGGSGLVVDLVPRKRWMETGLDGLAGEITADELHEAREAEDTLAATLVTVIKRFDGARGLVLSRTVCAEDVPVQWCVSVPPALGPGVLADLEAELIERGFAPRRNLGSWKGSVPPAGIDVTEEETTPAALGLAYYFYPPERFLGLHQSNVGSAFSDAEFVAGLDLAERIDAVLDEYKTARGISIRYPDALPGLQELVYNGLVAGALIRTDYTDEAQLAELREALAGLPLPDPVVIGRNGGWNNTGSTQLVRRMAGLEPVLVFHLSFEERCQVCLDTDLPKIFTEAESRGSRHMLEQIKGQVRDWLATQEPGTGAGVLETVAGDTVIRITVQCNRSDNATVESLARALQVTDPPTTYYLERASLESDEPGDIQGGIRYD